MKVRRFTAVTMQKALKTVREEMGPDAVILSNHRVKGGVEIIVAQNYKPVSAKDYPTPKLDSSEELADKPISKTEVTRTAYSKKSDPLGFLSPDQKQEVNDQLKLQTQLEELKRLRQKEVTPNKNDQHSVVDFDRHAARTVVDNLEHNNQPNLDVTSKGALEEALRDIKQARKNPYVLSDQAFSNNGSHIETNELQNQSLTSLINSSSSNDAPRQCSKSDADVNQHAANRSTARSSTKTKPNRHVLDDMRSELHDLKAMLMAQPSFSSNSTNQFVWKKQSPSNTLQAKFWQRLERMGLDQWIIYQLVHKISESENEKDVWQQILRELAQHLQLTPSDKLKQGGIYSLIGPTGAGKTTTIAKMAVRYVISHQENNSGNANIGLVTMDNYRLAAHDQLKTLGQILGIPVQIADQEHSVSQCLNELQHCDLILIDTPGLTPNHPMMSYQLNELKQLNKQVNNLLALPATSNCRVLRKVYHNYKAAGLSGCVLTKIDETGSLGDAISVLIESNLMLSYVTDGQRIPDDLHVASAKELIKQAVQIAQQEQLTHLSEAPVAAASQW